MNFKTRLILVAIFSFIFGWCLIGSVFAGGVVDDNNGNIGDILINTGNIGNGNNAVDVGTWKDASSFKGDKGDTGNTGQTGDTGQTGTSGTEGLQGVQGQNGLNGINGVDGKDVDQSTIDNFKANINNTNNKMNDLDNRLGELEKTQYYIEGAVRVKDTKKWQVQAPIVRYNFTRNKVDQIGVKFIYKVGKSYEEQRIDELEAQILKIENIVKHEENENLKYAEENYNITTTKDGTVITSKF